MNNKMKLTGFEIAIIGMDGRFPGAKNIDEFWNNLKNGIESISFFSEEELLETDIPPAQLENPDYIKANGFLEGIEYFDSSFFDYTPGEAMLMDPQVRIFHECSWKALEDAGYSPGTYSGIIGVYGGASPNFHWEARAALSGESINAGAWASTQLADKDYICTRVSYKLNLKGPSFSMNTACSTSLVAIHVACQAILNGECDMALAGGVSATLVEKCGYFYQEGMVASPDGHIRAFTAGPHGIVAGNGAVVIVLKRLEDAIADRDHIYAVIKGSAINNDGLGKVGFTAPGVEGQAQVIRSALLMAEVEPETIGYIETHGTATELGDTVEIEALKLAFNSDKRRFCPIGSLKTNMGHLDAAAGAAGVIKTALAIKNRLIPPSLHFNKPNPKIDFENSPFYVNRGLSPWENGTYPLRAGVSSFGIGGTNAHAILEEAPQMEVSSPSREFQLLLLSAKTEGALERITRNLANHLKENPGINLADTAYTLQTGRKEFQYRRMVVCPTHKHQEAVEYLTSPDYGDLQTRTALVTEKNRHLVFMFSGQGSQYVNMGRDLYQHESVFREEVDRCFHILESLTGKNVKDILYPFSQEGAGEDTSPDKINDLLYSGPVKLLFEYSLAKLLMAWGIKPHAMIGHSFGEYTTAALAGVFSLEDALKLAVLRGRLMQKTRDGAMMSVPLPEAELKPLLSPDLSLAAINAPALCIVSGPTESVNRFEKDLEEKGHECLRINFPRASHSQLMAPILEEFAQHVGRIDLKKPQIPYISGLTGTWITKEQATSPHYWARHMAETIRFADGIGKLIKDINPIFVQVGSDRGLPLAVNLHPIKKEDNFPINIIRHPKEKYPDLFYLLSKIGHLWISGARIDWSSFYQQERRNRIPLPTYSFERTPYTARDNIHKIAEQMVSGNTISPHDTAVLMKRPAAEIENESSMPMNRKQKRIKLSTEYAAPRDEMEKTFVEIFQQFFGIEPVGIYDDFYELGGDSLKAVQLAALIKKSHIDITFHHLLLHQNIHEICKNLPQPGKSDADMEAIALYLSKKYNAYVYYRTYHHDDLSYRILFLAHQPFDIRRVLEDTENRAAPGTNIYPHYITFISPGDRVPESGDIDRDVLPELLDLKNKFSANELYLMREELNKNDRLTGLLKKNNKTRKYGVSPTQKTFLIPPYKNITSNTIYYSYDFFYPLDITAIQKIVTALIQKNSLLRSVIVKRKGVYTERKEGYFIREFDSFANIRIPFIDLSSYSPACQEDIATRLGRHLKKPFDVLNHTLFRIVLVKVTHTQYRLVFLFNHLIFDGESVGILHKQLHSLSQGIEEPKEKETPIKDYRDYVNFLKEQNYENIQLEPYIHFPEYARAIEEILKNYHVQELKYEAFELDISIINERFKGYYNEIALVVYTKLLGQLFKVNKVPIEYISNGRVYKGAEFNHIIGDFPDSIPVLFPEDVHSNPRGVLDHFIQYKEFLKANNLNFLNYAYKGYITGIDNYAKLLSPFTFNSIFGNYHYWKKMEYEDVEREKRAGKHHPYFYMKVLEDYDGAVLYVTFLQNSGFAIKEVFMKNYFDLVHHLNNQAFGQEENVSAVLIKNENSLADSLRK
ncbi:MAG: acyltransferase domain-containing protein [Candidatus Aminicenantes bacterium]|nr:acyltransferase domain-containing protein [Candidatus Aminicenantes bacterium]NIM84635.1 acyltransferase domain-containing protein [Candidatus Aminicenantes bacterium]NIN24140.1 acyltransferase domain-containing protein [Candidatus Aminicenantes bacterium]NIN47864.1 acyltransferase domain-containing protein [Candidatus Aminicenantes bacterium]NIN90802.1 acyltransferase domain-containing protein [Candidatus Aminicenantes bacterium]